MKKSRFLILLSGIFVLLSIFYVGNNILFKSDEKVDIYEILQTKAYAYLPNEAKDYVSSVYQKTGVLLLTEKNKEKNVPYLNPRFVTYLSLEEQEKKETELIPKETIIDYVISNENNIVSSTETLPSTYDLRNVNGKNFVTPIKNQGSLGLCWAFATVAQVESYLLVNSDTSYDTNAEIFSERQIDYATSTNGIKGYDSEYSRGNLGSGGNFNEASSLMKDAISLVDSSSFPYNDGDYSTKELKDVLNYTNSNYEVNNTIEMPFLNFTTLDLTNAENLNKKNAYLNNIKNKVISYGGGYVGTSAPTLGCSWYDSNSGTSIIYDDDTCHGEGHAMQLIGWNDNYEYQFCQTGTGHNTAVTDSCSQGNIVTGKGVWILKNSWGNIYPYVYLAYDSMYTDFDFITDISSSDLKDWTRERKIVHDNEYAFINNQYINNYVLDDLSTFNEKIVKVKLRFYSQNKEIKFYINKTGTAGDYELIDTITSEFPGLYSIDLSNKNISFNDSSKLKLAVSSGAYIEGVYTSIIDDETSIKTFDSTFQNTMENAFSSNYELMVYSKTENIPSNQMIQYKLFDSKGVDYSSHLTYRNNVVAHNDINTTLIIDSSVSAGEYTLKSYYNNIEKCTSKIILTPKKSISGAGTESSPYMITTPDELAMINEQMNSYFALGNDIDLTYDTTNPNGIFYNNGEGWIPLGLKTATSFSGHLNGNGYSIIGLSSSTNGLFYKIAPSTEDDTTISIENIILKDFNVKGNNSYYVGGLASYLYDVTSYYVANHTKITLKNISLIDSEIGYGPQIGGIIGSLTAYKKDSIVITNIFSNSILNNTSNETFTKIYGGIIGSVYVNSNYELDANVTISNIENIGKIIQPTTNGVFINSELGRDSAFGGIIGNIYGNVILNNLISNCSYEYEYSYDDWLTINNINLYYGSLIGIVDQNDDFNGNGSITNAYYQNDDPFGIKDNNFVINNVLKKDISLLKNNSLYTNWTSFDTNWKIETINNIKRIPVLKFVDFQYTTILDINITTEGNSINLYDMITPNTEAAKKISFQINDPTIASITDDGIITGLKSGETSIHIISYYDGYEKDVPLTVTGRTKVIMSFDSNEGSTVSNISGYAGDTIAKPTDPTRMGYVFRGWYTDDGTFQNEYSFSTMPENNLTLYAKWDKIYTITFNTNGGSTVSNISGCTGDTITKPTDPSATGYTFGGWYTDNGTFQNEYTFSTMPENDLTIYAKWNVINYSVTYDSNGGSNITTGTTSYNIKSISINLPTNPTKTGYDFKGWKIINNTGHNWDIDKLYQHTKVTDGYLAYISLNGNYGDISFKAQWTKKVYNITYNADGGSEIVDGDETYDVESTSIHLPESPTKTGYEFGGWKLVTATNSWTLNTIYNNNIITTSNNYGNITLKAVWTPKVYSITYNTDGGSQASDGETTYNIDLTSIVLPTIPTKEGYNFKGWKLITCENNWIINTIYKNSTISLNNNYGNIVLKAIWEEKIDVTINDYVVEDDYLKQVKEKTTKTDFAKKFTYSNDYSLKLFKNNVEITDNVTNIGTGSIVRIYKMNNLAREYTIIIKGDNNGDGKISALDYVKIKNHIMKTKLITEEVYSIASDYDNSGKISAMDYVKIKNYIMNGDN